MAASAPSVLPCPALVLVQVLAWCPVLLMAAVVPQVVQASALGPPRYPTRDCQNPAAPPSLTW
jgi:hypothetical protein